ncbi:hypothetical protein [Humibacillus xanthopallidus]|uniref:hypothetical protein n=1 Tax=Humibacillus xanthopallidus TaxID=412689 RepID=UPI0011526DB8|nr:hypothetical protein [Humibacillus xanthopallidus]
MSDLRPDGEQSAAAGAPLVCATCGRRPESGEAATARLTWSRVTSGAAAAWTCDRCSREHLRSIEGKLDPDWW